MPLGSDVFDKMCEIDTLEGFLYWAAERHNGYAAAISDVNGGMEQKSFADLRRDADSVAGFLRGLGFHKKNMAVIGKLCYDWIAVFFGIVISGNVAVPVDKNLGLEDIETQIEVADIVTVFADNTCAKTVQGIDKDCERVEHIFGFCPLGQYPGVWDAMNRAENLHNAASQKKILADQTAMIVFTSGTSGPSKGVMLSHRNICHNVICSVVIMGLHSFSQGEHIVPILPPHHMFEVTTGILTPMYYGVALCFGGGLKYLQATLKKYKPVIAIVVPLVLENIYKKIFMDAKARGKDRQLRLVVLLSRCLLRFHIDVRQKLFKEILDSLGGALRIVVCGGAQLSSDLAAFFDAIGIDLLNGYGITECSPVLACNRSGNKKRASVGPASPEPYCQVKTEDGEILVRGSIVMQGYYNDVAATEQAISGGWFRTGDLGYVDKDGFIFITGRKKNLIILKDGNNISPEEVERRLEQLPLVKSVFVRPAEKNGVDFLQAVLHPDYDYAEENGIDDIMGELTKTIREINKKWPRYRHIQSIEISENDFEKTALGKIKRFRY